MTVSTKKAQAPQSNNAEWGWKQSGMSFFLLGLLRSICLPSNQIPPDSTASRQRPGWATYLGSKTWDRLPNVPCTFISTSEGLSRYFPQVKGLKTPIHWQPPTSYLLTKNDKIPLLQINLHSHKPSLLENSEAFSSHITLGLYYLFSYKNNERYIKRERYIQTIQPPCRYCFYL